MVRTQRHFCSNLLILATVLCILNPVSWASPLTDTLTHSIQSRLEDALLRKKSDSTIDINTLFTENNAPIGKLTWNKNVWAKDLDFTGVGWWNSADGYYRRATLITPRHLLIVTHYSLSVGNDIVFLDKKNTLVTRKIGKKTTLTLPASKSGGALKSLDIDLLELEEDVPDSIKFYPLFDITTFGPQIDDTFPVISLNQDNMPSILPITYSENYSETSIRNTYKGKLISGNVYEDKTLIEPFQAFRQNELRGGDSSNPLFAVVENSLVLFSNHSRTASSTNLSWFVGEINTAIAEMGSEYRVTVFDVNKQPRKPKTARITLSPEPVKESPIGEELNSAPEKENPQPIKQNPSTEKGKSTSESTPSEKAISVTGAPSPILSETITDNVKTPVKRKESELTIARRNLTTSGILQEDFRADPASPVKRIDVLAMSLRASGQSALQVVTYPRPFGGIYTRTFSKLLIDTASQAKIISSTNRNFSPRRYATRAEAFSMIMKSTCMPMKTRSKSWMRNLYETAKANKLTTQSWVKFEGAREVTNAELIIMTNRILEYQSTHTSCAPSAD